MYTTAYGGPVGPDSGSDSNGFIPGGSGSNDPGSRDSGSSVSITNGSGSGDFGSSGSITNGSGSDVRGSSGSGSDVRGSRG